MAVWDFLGHARLNAGKVAEAEAIFRQGLRTNPMACQYGYGLGCVAEVRGDTALARQFYETVIKVDPGFARAYERLGYLFEMGDQPDSAAYYYLRFRQATGGESVLDQLERERSAANNR
jgi:Flp pilus assembly protein TadD